MAKLVYAAMSADIIHTGHLNIIREAQKYGTLMVGVLTDEAIASYKRLPYLDFQQRITIVSQLKGVDRAVITIKGGGMYYREGDSEGVLRPERVISFASTSGAGDVVSAAVVAGSLEGKTMEETAGDAMEKAALFLNGVEDRHIYDDML